MATYYAINVPKTQPHEVPYYGAGTVRTLYACLACESVKVTVDIQYVQDVVLLLIQFKVG